MKEDPSNSRRKDWSIPNNTTHVLLYSAGGWHGYQFLDGPITRINRRAIRASTSDGMKIVIVGGQVNELSVSEQENTLDGALAGFYKSSDFENKKKKPYSAETCFEIHWTYDGITRTLESRHEVEVLGEDEVVLTFFNGRKLRVVDQNLSLICRQVRKSDDDYDLSKMTPPSFSITAGPERR